MPAGRSRDCFNNRHDDRVAAQAVSFQEDQSNQSNQRLEAASWLKLLLR
jgi:hypothetical protein